MSHVTLSWAGGTAIDRAYRRVFASDCNEPRTGHRRGMQRIEPIPEPPDRDGYPPLHSDRYDFTDAAITTGMRMFVELVRNFGK